MSDESLLVTAKTCSESVFSQLYEDLYQLSKDENHAMYLQALSKAKTPRQRQKCAGAYVGRWQTVFNAWCRGKIANTFVHEAIQQGFVSEGLLLRAEQA